MGQAATSPVHSKVRVDTTATTKVPSTRLRRIKVAHSKVRATRATRVRAHPTKTREGRMTVTNRLAITLGTVHPVPVLIRPLRATLPTHQRRASQLAHPIKGTLPLHSRATVVTVQDIKIAYKIHKLLQANSRTVSVT